MLSFEEIGAMLDDIADELPEDFYRELNGGINLLPDIKKHPESKNDGSLYILGEYHRESRGLGRYINIYYGSFTAVNGYRPAEQQKSELRRILLHEFTHHLESMAGERGLEIKDKIMLEKYKNS